MITESVFRSRGSCGRQTDRTERQTDHMMRITLALLLPVLLLQLGQTEAAAEDSPPTPTPPSQPNPKHTLKLARLTLTPRPEAPHPSLISQECRSKNYTRSSCAKVFCPPWQRCINEQCVCKLPYQCPRTGPGACGLDGRGYLTMCHAQALACRRRNPIFSHYSQHGVCAENSFTVQLQELEGQQVIRVSTVQATALICGSDGWNMAAANVVCRHTTKDARGALAFKAVASAHTCPGGVCECVSVRCSGAEQSLAECVLYKPHSIRDNTSVATVTCYTDQQGREECPAFRCVNEKCVSWKHVCDGVDDCGDNSDEMCCTGCQEDAFHCPSGVCLPRSAVGDQIRDCLGGEDETQPKPDTPEEQLLKEIWSNPIDDIKKARNHTEILQCGIPNMDYVHKTEEETRYKRTKRVVGGDEALPTQIQWQVAVQEDKKIYCGGVYLGGCWVLTAAHCVRPKPLAFRIKFSLWMKWTRISTTDSVPVKNIIMHHNYNPRTYQNDIALIQLQELANEKECLQPNPAVRPVCLPWSRLQFPPNSTCTISGWGRNREGDSVTVLRWANVSLIQNCRNFYKERFYDGMMCAGDLEGKVDSCQGDSGGPLVCKDASGVSYVWGIVSWGERCGEAGYPGVYTEVAHYFEWIRQHTGWPAVTKYNQ